jgi:hypothetical protein
MPRLDGIKYLRIIGAQGYCCKAAGDVHGVSLETVPQIRAVLGARFSCAVVIREPIPRLHSHLGLFAKFKGLHSWNLDHVDPLLGRLNLPDRSYETRLFVHGVNLLNMITAEFGAAPVYRSEDLTSDPLKLRDFVEFITGGNVKFTDEWVETVLGRPAVNAHQPREQKTRDFEDWQIGVIRSIVSPEAWRIYSKFGYEVPSFVRDLVET